MLVRSSSAWIARHGCRRSNGPTSVQRYQQQQHGQLAVAVATARRCYGGSGTIKGKTFKKSAPDVDGFDGLAMPTTVRDDTMRWNDNHKNRRLRAGAAQDAAPGDIGLRKRMTAASNETREEQLARQTEYLKTSMAMQDQIYQKYAKGYATADEPRAEGEKASEYDQARMEWSGRATAKEDAAGREEMAAAKKGGEELDTPWTHTELAFLGCMFFTLCFLFSEFPGLV